VHHGSRDAFKNRFECINPPGDAFQAAGEAFKMKQKCITRRVTHLTT
jgi:hypothetical protein